MERLRHSVIVLLLALAVLYNIERLDFGVENLINLHSFFYLLAFVAALSILKVPRLFQTSFSLLAALWIGIYILLRLLLSDGEPLLGGVYTYLLFTEIGLLVLVVGLTRNVALDIHDFEEAVENLTFSDVHRKVKELAESGEDIETELLRSRRYQRPLSVMIVHPDARSIEETTHRTVEQVQRAMMSRYMITSLARTISSELRRTEFIMEERERGRFIIMSPETNKESSTALAQRLRKAASRMGIAIHCGISTFPEEAVTFEELVRQAERNLEVTGEGSVSLPYVKLDTDEKISHR